MSIYSSSLPPAALPPCSFRYVSAHATCMAVPCSQEQSHAHADSRELEDLAESKTLPVHLQL